jgi:hypothetical protein
MLKLISPIMVLGSLLLVNPMATQTSANQLIVPIMEQSYAEVPSLPDLSEFVFYQSDEEDYIVETELSDEDYDLLADLVMAEAEDQSWDAQYGVACVVLNRMKSGLFPDTISDVVYDRNGAVQFSCTADGRLNKIIAGKASDSVMEAVGSALEHNDYPDDVLYFTSCGYLSGTDQYKQEDDMYFSRQRSK